MFGTCAYTSLTLILVDVPRHPKFQRRPPKNVKKKEGKNESYDPEKALKDGEEKKENGTTEDKVNNNQKNENGTDKMETEEPKVEEVKTEEKTDKGKPKRKYIVLISVSNFYRRCLS